MANEKRLIYADELIKKFCDRKDLFLNKMGGFQALLQREKGRVDELDNCIADVINAPTVDAVEVVHGRWIKRKEVFGEIYCSECGTIEKTTDSNFKTPHCPWCGAEMDMEVDK